MDGYREIQTPVTIQPVDIGDERAQERVNIVATMAPLLHTP